MIFLKLITHTLFAAFYFIWLLLFLVVAFMGLLLPVSDKALSSEIVDRFKTICRILLDKKELSEEEYAFESQQVAPKYDLATFNGYRWIVWPVTKVMSLTNHFDAMIMFFVRRWMRVHQHRISNEKAESPVYGWITDFVTFVAQCVGRVLFKLQ